jgi:hypothetical protein
MESFAPKLEKAIHHPSSILQSSKYKVEERLDSFEADFRGKVLLIDEVL